MSAPGDAGREGSRTRHEPRVSERLAVIVQSRGDRPELVSCVEQARHDHLSLRLRGQRLGNGQQRLERAAAEPATRIDRSRGGASATLERRDPGAGSPAPAPGARGLARCPARRRAPAWRSDSCPAPPPGDRRGRGRASAALAGPRAVDAARQATRAPGRARRAAPAPGRRRCASRARAAVAPRGGRSPPARTARRRSRRVAGRARARAPRGASPQPPRDRRRLPPPTSCSKRGRSSWSGAEPERVARCDCHQQPGVRPQAPCASRETLACSAAAPESGASSGQSSSISRSEETTSFACSRSSASRLRCLGPGSRSWPIAVEHFERSENPELHRSSAGVSRLSVGCKRSRAFSLVHRPHGAVAEGKERQMSRTITAHHTGTRGRGRRGSDGAGRHGSERQPGDRPAGRELPPGPGLLPRRDQGARRSGRPARRQLPARTTASRRRKWQPGRLRRRSTRWP